MKIKQLIHDEELHLAKLDELVGKALAEEELISTKILECEEDETITKAQFLADKIAEFGGSWTFILSFFFVMLVWILLNVLFLNTNAFDPYPFILLNLILSCLAALQAPIIMMSQNRQEIKDRKRSRSDYMINLKSEIEIRNLHSKVDLLMTDQMKSLFAIQKTQLELLENLEKKFKT